MVASHATNKHSEDKIFATSKQATDAVSKYGKEKVVNATIGAIMDDEENLAVLPSVIEVFRKIPEIDIAAYAPIAGTADYLDAAIRASFMDVKPEGYIKAVATPGGSGAIRHIVWNYSELYDAVLTSNWYWGPYKTIADENLRKLETFEFFTEDKKFNISSFETKVKELLSRQNNLLILLNSPAHNPTGFGLSDSEYNQVFEVLKEASTDKSKRIILFSDIAYIDYAGPDARNYMKNFSNLPENILIVVSFSISKSLTMYGLRTGAVIGISKSKEVCEEFFDVCQFSNRGTWSNGNRCGMKLLSMIMNDNAILEKVYKEREFYYDLLVKRSSIFMNEANQVKLDICPYKAGFFITIPTADPDGACETLKSENIFTVPIAGGLRFAICSVPEYKLPGVAAKIKSSLK